MGIQGLLTLVKDVAQPTHVSAYAGSTVAIDGYAWLHRGSYSCSYELAQNKPTDKYISFCVRRLELLQHYGVTPLMVFDGAPLPSKALEEEQRRARRADMRAQANHYLQIGDRTAAHKCFKKCVDITPEMAFNLIQKCRDMGIESIVAPYEADAQMAYLAHTGRVNAIITEDSDLLVYGCPTVLFKMDEGGYGSQIRFKEISASAEFGGPLTLECFRRVCILSGCDYLPSILGMGLKTARKLLAKFHTVEDVLHNVSGTMSVPRDYLERFRRAELTFLHHLVYDPGEGRIVHVTPLPDYLCGREDELSFLGRLDIPPETAAGIANGRLHPITYEPFHVPQAAPARMFPWRPQAAPSAVSNGLVFNGVTQTAAERLTSKTIVATAKMASWAMEGLRAKVSGENGDGNGGDARGGGNDMDARTGVRKRTLDEAASDACESAGSTEVDYVAAGGESAGGGSGEEMGATTTLVSFNMREPIGDDVLVWAKRQRSQPIDNPYKRSLSGTAAPAMDVDGPIAAAQTDTPCDTRAPMEGIEGTQAHVTRSMSTGSTYDPPPKSVFENIPKTTVTTDAQRRRLQPPQKKGGPSYFRGKLIEDKTQMKLAGFLVGSTTAAKSDYKPPRTCSAPEISLEALSSTSVRTSAQQTRNPFLCGTDGDAPLDQLQGASDDRSIGGHRRGVDSASQWMKGDDSNKENVTESRFFRSEKSSVFESFRSGCDDAYDGAKRRKTVGDAPSTHAFSMDAEEDPTFVNCRSEEGCTGAGDDLRRRDDEGRERMSATEESVFSAELRQFARGAPLSVGLQRRPPHTAQSRTTANQQSAAASLVSSLARAPAAGGDSFQQLISNADRGKGYSNPHIRPVAHSALLKQGRLLGPGSARRSSSFGLISSLSPLLPGLLQRRNSDTAAVSHTPED